MAAIDDYLNLVPPEHQNRERFIASLSAALQPMSDVQGLLASMPAKYDLDIAEGQQLDMVGLWVGVSRKIMIAITGVFFSFDTVGLGFNQGIWRNPRDNNLSAVFLDDESYRMLLRARIAANHWDGTLAAAATAYAYVFRDPNTHVFIQDNQDHTFSLNVAGMPLTTLQMALLTGGYLPLRPVGVRLGAVNVVSIGGAPLFGFDNNTALVAGFDIGAWGSVVGP